MKIKFPQGLLEEFDGSSERYEDFQRIAPALKTLVRSSNTQRLKGKNQVGDDGNLGPAIKAAQLFEIRDGNSFVYGTDRFDYGWYYNAWRNRQAKLSKKGKTRLADAATASGRQAAVNQKGSTNKKMNKVLYYGGKLSKRSFNLIYYWTMFGDANGGSRDD